MSNFAARMKAVLDRSTNEHPESSVVMDAGDLCELVSRSRSEDLGMQRAAKLLKGSHQTVTVPMVQFREMANAVIGVDPVTKPAVEDATVDEQTA